ncbi:MAG: hypothetical protein P1V20_29085 [Verrucomicrobiales bacterium]|nr:hypothetical protein [Verrucomicrobiales bacterium]
MPKFLSLTLVFVCLVSITGCSGGKRKKLEHARVQTLLIHCRAYATDHNGNYPSGLTDLFPKYIQLASNFYSPPHNATDDLPQAYYYRPGLNVGAKVDEPLVVSPHVVKGKVNVGYVGGFVRTLDKEDAQKILAKPEWEQKAPSLK